MDMIKRPRRLRSGEALRKMVRDTGAASTDYQSPESADHLCDKTTPYAEGWKTTADKLWYGCSSCTGYGKAE